jgi:hypothetical protein
MICVPPSRKFTRMLLNAGSLSSSKHSAIVFGLSETFSVSQ